MTSQPVQCVCKAFDFPTELMLRMDSDSKDSQNLNKYHSSLHTQLYLCPVAYCRLVRSLQAGWPKGALWARRPRA